MVKSQLVPNQGMLGIILGHCMQNLLDLRRGKLGCGASQCTGARGGWITVLFFMFLFVFILVQQCSVDSDGYQG